MFCPSWKFPSTPGPGYLFPSLTLVLSSLFTVSSSHLHLSPSPHHMSFHMGSSSVLWSWHQPPVTAPSNAYTWVVTHHVSYHIIALAGKCFRQKEQHEQWPQGWHECGMPESRRKESQNGWSLRVRWRVTRDGTTQLEPDLGRLWDTHSAWIFFFFFEMPWEANRRFKTEKVTWSGLCFQIWGLEHRT